MKLKEELQAEIDALGDNYKTADIDRIIDKYVKAKTDFSDLRGVVLAEQQFHRIYFHGSLKQIKDGNERLKWIDKNLLFSDWWHTDQCINSVRNADIETALDYARRYVNDNDPFVRRWGYVMFISKLCRNEKYLNDIIGLIHNDNHYYVQMGEAWLIAELAIFFPNEIKTWLSSAELEYNIAGKAIQKICDSFRIPEEVKTEMKKLRNRWKGNC